MRGSIGLQQAEAVVGALRAVGQTLEHPQVGEVQGGGQQVAHLTHKLGQHHLQGRNTQHDGRKGKE